MHSVPVGMYQPTLCPICQWHSVLAPFNIANDWKKKFKYSNIESRNGNFSCRSWECVTVYSRGGGS